MIVRRHHNGHASWGVILLVRVGWFVLHETHYATSSKILSLKPLQKRAATPEMNKRLVLMGPYPPPYGGVAIFTRALFEFVKDRGVKLWAMGEKFRDPNV